MADQHHRRARIEQGVLEVLDGRDVEMVGRLVEKKNVGIGSQNAGERRATAFAARKAGRILVAGQAQLIEQHPCPVRIVAGCETRLDEGGRRREAAQVGFLWQIAEGDAGLQEAAAGIGLDQPGGELQQRRLAGAVPPDQAEPLAGADRQFGAAQERRAAKGEPNVLKDEKGGCHLAGSRLAECGAAEQSARGSAFSGVERRDAANPRVSDRPRGPRASRSCRRRGSKRTPPLLRVPG